MKPIYEHKGRAKKYGDLALNIYTGCPHACYCCFAPNVLRKEKERFHSVVEPRKDIVSETKKQLENDHMIEGNTPKEQRETIPIEYIRSTIKSYLTLVKKPENAKSSILIHLQANTLVELVRAWRAEPIHEEEKTV